MTELEQYQQKQLTKMQRIASGLLCGMFIVFLAAKFGESNFPELGFVRAFAEAAMVGALADWFAVTALFRRPMGLPIPHTAIIPTNKDRIGESLGLFVQNNFLSPEILTEKLQNFDLASKFADWLASHENSAVLSQKICDALPALLNALSDEDVRNFIEKNISERIRAVEAAPLAGNILATLTSGNRHQQLLDEALKFAGQFLQENKSAIREKITQESPWYIPQFVDNKLYEKIITKAEETLREVNFDPHHELRRKFTLATQDFVQKLKNSPEYHAKGEEIKEEILSSPIVQQYFGSIWTDIKQKIIADANSPDSALRKHIENALLGFGESLKNDSAIRQKINDWVQSAAVHLISERRGEVGNLIAETVRKWDSATMTRKIELQTGRDLQFIRINGTIVGGLVGLVIYVISRLLF